VLLQAKPRDAAIDLNKQLMISSAVNNLFSCLLLYQYQSTRYGENKPVPSKARQLNLKLYDVPDTNYAILEGHLFWG